MGHSKIIHVSEISLKYKTKVAAKDRLKISSSEDSYKVLYKTWNKDTMELHEEFIILLLNHANYVLGRVSLSIGTTKATMVDLKFIVVAISKANASGLIIAHNHPSGKTTPSYADRKITKNIGEICKMLDVSLIDHIVITPHDGYFSFRDRNFL